MKIACFTDEVEVVLSPVASHLTSEPLSRHIVLDRENPIITIGRTTSKGGAEYKQSSENAWIDCPVISRYHAQIKVDLGSKSLKITDLGSLHGTFKNGERLVPQEPQLLKQDDILKFGIAINKNDKYFLPYTMKASFRFGTESRVATLPRTFRVPDSDGEDEDIYDADDSVGRSVKTLLDKGFRPAQLSSDTAGPSSDVIDLTMDNKESKQVSPVSEHDQDTDSDQDDLSSLFIRDDLLEQRSSSAAPASNCGNCEIPSSPPDNDNGRSMISDAQILASFSTSSASDASVAEKMGTKFGKAEYFSARYHNKCTLESATDNDLETTRHQDCSSVTPQQVVNANNAINDAGMEHVPTYGLLASGENFLKSPQRDASPLAAAAPIELDDTSAFQFEMSKKAMSRAIETMLGTSSSSDDEVVVTDLHEEACAEPVHRKRKIDDISEVTREEAVALEMDKTAKQTIQSLSDSTENLVIGQPMSEVSQPEFRAPAVMEAAAGREVPDAVAETPRPIKRLRKAAEIFGYAALGGVAVMSALIATAPDL
ncbi:hypothetical protein CDD81_54 [Ophiocordyceps australis]|uniref:FHA domain-containing protein n=1 Tax=Ophiocordyceps australis TaxID=1399860 RepID=A0A2C5YJF9_9HYPO|nr:hypothetical protein CDD81_54 [Ophiocordyceps australis]